MGGSALTRTVSTIAQIEEQGGRATLFVGLRIQHVGLAVREITYRTLWGLLVQQESEVVAGGVVDVVVRSMAGNASSVEGRPVVRASGPLVAPLLHHETQVLRGSPRYHQ
jgi:hypothetical protein